MARKPTPKQPRYPARLRLEALEERSLLTLGAFSVNLYQDAGGGPGALITDDTVQVGEASGTVLASTASGKVAW